MKNQQTVQHKCPNCGAYLKYDPSNGNLRCEHCDGVVSFEKSHDVQERDFSELDTFSRWKESDVACYRCANCGAVVVSPRTTLATTCPYCSSPVIVQDQAGDIVKPDTIIPFELTSKQAAEQLSRWRKRKIYAPQRFRNKTTEASVKGVFVPTWTFDAETDTEYDGTVGYQRTRTVRRNGKTVTETYIQWKHISGRVRMSFDDILVRANDNVSDAEFVKLQPFPQEKYKVFDDEYLAGYIADHYTLQPKEAFARAKNKMMVDIRRRIREQHNADVEGTINTNMHILSKSFKYLLIPVYVASTRYNKKLYNQYVSGVFTSSQKQEAKVCGKAPVSPWKVLLTVLAGVGIVALLAFLAFCSASDWGDAFSALTAFVKI